MKKLFLLSSLLLPCIAHAMSREAIVLKHLSDKSVLKPLMLKRDPKTMLLYNCFLKNIYAPLEEERKTISAKWQTQSIKDSEILTLTRAFQYQCISYNVYGELGLAGEVLSRHDGSYAQFACNRAMKDTYDSEEIAKEAVLIIKALAIEDEKREEMRKELKELKTGLSEGIMQLYDIEDSEPEEVKEEK